MKAWCINLDKRPERWEHFKQNVFPFEVQRVSGVEHPIGAHGCVQAHMKAMQLFDTNDINILFEDDCLMLHDWSEVEKAIAELPADWHALYLGAMLHAPITRHSEHLFRLQMGWSSHAIIFNGRTIADEILKHTPEQIHGKWRNIDTWCAHEVQPHFNCFIAYPLLAVQRPNVSDITGLPRDYNMDLNYKNYTHETSTDR